MATASSPIRAALIGCGGFGHTHLRCMTHYADAVRLVAACDPNPPDTDENLNAFIQAGTRMFDDYQAMLDALADQLDLVVIATGIPLHAPMATAVANAGINCLLEKPPVVLTRDLDALVQAFKDGNARCNVGFQYQHNPVMRQAMRQIADGRIGSVQWVSVVAKWPRDRNYYARNGWAGTLEWQGQATLDGPAMNACSHAIMLGLSLAGAQPVARVAGLQAELYRAKDIPASPVQAHPSPNRQRREKHSSECANVYGAPEGAFRLACARGSDCRAHDHQQCQSTAKRLYRTSHDTAFIRAELEHGPSLYVAMTHAGNPGAAPMLVTVQGTQGHAVITPRSIRWFDQQGRQTALDDPGDHMLYEWEQVLAWANGQRDEPPWELHLTGNYVELINLAHIASGRVHAIDAEYTDTVSYTPPGRTQPNTYDVAIGMHEHIDECLAARALPSEMAVIPWGASSRSVRRDDLQADWFDQYPR